MNQDQLLSIVADYRRRRLPWRQIAKLLEEEHGIIKDYRNLHQWWQRKLKAARKLSKELEPLEGLLQQKSKNSALRRPTADQKTKPRFSYDPDNSDIRKQ